MKKYYELAVYENEQELTRIHISKKEYKQQIKNLRERINELSDDIENSCNELPILKRNYTQFAEKIITFNVNLTDVCLIEYTVK